MKKTVEKKRRPGRPPGWKKPDGIKKQVTFRLHPSIIKKLKTTAEKFNKSQAEIVADGIAIMIDQMTNGAA